MPSNHCEGCPLSGIGSPVRVPEASMTRFVVVTDTPSAYNAGEGRLLAKSAAKLLGASMAAAGFAREDFTMFPQSRCPYNKDEFTTKEQKAIRDHCRGYLDDFLKASAPEAIIPLGAEPTRQVLGRAVKITKVRGVIEHSQEYGTKVFPMLNPGMVLMYPQHRVTFDMDCIALRDLAEVSYRLKVRARRMLGDYEFIDDLQFLIDAEPDILFYDTETTGLSFFAPGTHDVRDYDPSVHGKEFAPRPAVLTLQFAIEPEKSYMLVWDHPENPVPLRRKRRLREQLRLLLNNPKTRVVGQNAKYDRVFTESCLGVSYPIGGDTLMLATLLDENAISKGQDMLVRQYVPAMAGYADCVDPDTLLLMEDLTKKRAGDIQPSDRLIGFQEYAVNGTSRKMVPTVVESVRRLRMPSFVICMMDGRRIQVSGNHQFLKGPLREQFGGSWKWVTADSLRVGDRLKLFPFPEEERTFDAGWMAGLLDGEGYITNHGNAGMRLGFCQLEGPVLEEGVRLFNKGENLQISWDKRKRLANVTVSGYRAMSELIRLRPRRLLGKKPWEGKALFVGDGSQGRIKSIEYVGRCDVMSIQTSSRTFIANGFATHNCFNATYDKSRMWEIPLSELISYGCGDTDSGYRLHTVLYDMVRKDRKLLAHYVRVTLPGLNAFAAIEQRGMYVDEAALDVFESVVAQDVEERYQSLISQVPRSIKRAHIEKGLKFSRGDFIRDILFYHKDGFRLTPKVFTQTTAKLPPDRRVASTSSKNHLPYFYDTHPFTYELTEYIQSERLLGTNIRGFKKKYIVDGLVRPTYSLWTAVTGRSACVRADTPVVTSRGLVRADAIRVGDRVFTHAYRWKPVTVLFRKDPALMYDVYLSNGEVLPVTAHHRVMLDSGLWADIGYILEGLGYVISQQATDAEPTVSTSCSDDVYTGRSIQYAEGYEIPTVKTSGENSAVQEAAVFRLHGWEGVPNPLRDVSVASGYTRQVVGPRRGVTIEKVVCAGVHRVYDFEVADDHSYLACGVFNHNSENPNGQNIPKRGKLAKAYRRSFVAPRGYLVIEADLSQAELRIAASMANEATMLSVYRNAGDIHTETALIALGITRTKFKELPKAEQKSARQKAKAVNFGFCIAEGQRVLTHVGLVPIEDIQDWHRVWDGVEWVTHRGLVCRGEQEVITYDGLTATPDHEVFTEGHSDPVRLGDCASSLEKRRIVVSGDASHPVRVIIPNLSVREARAQPALLRSGVLRVRRVTLDIGGQYLVRQDYELQMSDEEVPSRCAGRDSWAEIRCYGATVREVDTQEFEKLQRTRYSRVVSDETEFHRVGINEVAFGDLQGQGLRPDQQRRRLLSREFTAGLAFGESKEPAEKETGTPRKVRVYDLIDAGPRRRFTVEGRLVSNCYGMGWRKFIGYAKTQYGVEFTDEEAQRIRVAFFKKYSGLSSWHERQRQAAMRDGQVRSYSGRIRHLPMIYSDDEMVQQEAGRQSINSPVQEFASSLGVMAIGRLSAEIDPQYLAPIAFVHDAIFCYVKEEYLEWGAKTLKWYMESNPLEEWFGLRMPCPIVADVSFGENFGDTFEMEGLVLDQPYDFTRFETSDDGGPTIYVPEQYDPPNYGLLAEIDK